LQREIFGRNRSLIYRWIREAGLRTAEPTVDGEITQIEFDERWHFIESEKGSFGSSRPLIAAAAGQSPGFPVIVIAQLSDACTIK
jgi:hypothetical protein